MALIMLVASEPMPLYPHIDDYTVTSTCTSSAHYNVVVTAALQNVVRKPSPFHSPAPIAFNIGMWRKFWRLKTTLREPIWEFTRVNEIAEHIMILTHEQDHYGTYS